MIKDCHGPPDPQALFKSILCHLFPSKMSHDIKFIVSFLLLEHKP